MQDSFDRWLIGQRAGGTQQHSITIFADGHDADPQVAIAEPCGRRSQGDRARRLIRGRPALLAFVYCGNLTLKRYPAKSHRSTAHNASGYAGCASRLNFAAPLNPKPQSPREFTRVVWMDSITWRKG